MNTNSAKRREAAIVRAWMNGVCDGYQCGQPATQTRALAAWMADPVAHPVRWEFCEDHAHAHDYRAFLCEAGHAQDENDDIDDDQL